MSEPKVIFIAGERQHAGKTVSSLGLVSALCNRIDPKDIGYFKPVGQEMVKLSSGERIDKDVLIVQKFTELNMPDDLAILSPVRVVDGVTRDYITCTNPAERTAAFERAIQRTVHHLRDKRVIIAEGTGHPGVGSVIGLSNARVANLLKAQILYLVGGGIGRTLDELEVDLSYFAHQRCNVGGVLFNKVIPDKVAMMKSVLDEALLKRRFPEWDPALGIFGYMPKVVDLNNPSMTLIAKSFASPRILGNRADEAWRIPCREVKVISQGAESFVPEEHLVPRDIAVLGAGSHRRLKRILAFNAGLKGDKLGGIVLTCAGPSMPDETAVAWIGESRLPVIAVSADAGAVDQTLYTCFKNTKLQIYDQHKHAQIVELFKEHFDVKRFIRRFGI
jgi:uncharacterized protein